jgi:hypothetical protein
MSIPAPVPSQTVTAVIADGGSTVATITQTLPLTSDPNAWAQARLSDAIAAGQASAQATITLRPTLASMIAKVQDPSAQAVFIQMAQMLGLA